MTKLLEVVSNLENVGGSETFSVNFTKYAKLKTKFALVILYNSVNRLFLEQIEQTGVEVIILNKRKGFDFLTIKKLSKIIDDFAPDYIHTENNALLTAGCAIMFSKKSPLIFHTFHLNAYIESGNKINKIFYRWLFKHKMAHPVAISEENKNSIVNCYNLHEDDVSMIINGTNIENFSNYINCSERNYDICVVARFSHPKKYHFMVDVIDELNKLRPIKVCFAGDGPDYTKVEQYINEKTIINIELLGNINNVHQYLSQSKVFMLFSEFEANPISVIEAISAGCYVCGSEINGMSFLVKHGINGSLYSNDSTPFEVANFLNNLFDSDDLIKVSKENYSLKNMFDFSVVMDRYIELFISTTKKNH